LVGLALWATFASYRQDEATSEDGRALPTPTVSPSPQDESEGDPASGPRYSEPFGIVVGTLFVAALGAMTVALLLLFRKQEVREGARSLEAELIEELEAGLEDLLAIDDPRAAVIACYSRMETVVHLAGVEAAASDTPFELLARILQRADVSEESARRLTELFEEAKFSTRAIDEPMRQEALGAIRAVREEIAGRAEAPETKSPAETT
ncbi:MAG: DUF4129 domain-containing protein, partial [Actinomycetota bacterium]|nr:DUF4129 domain-containing protein [Actinomycetota bacterium]